MRIFLVVVAVLCGLVAVGLFKAASSAIHEIEGLIASLGAVVAISGAAVVDAVKAGNDRIINELMRSNSIASLDRKDRQAIGPDLPRVAG